MTLESSFNAIEDLNPSYPEGSALISGGDDHIRGIKNALYTQLGGLGPNPITVTADHLNNTITTEEDSEVSGSITFADENHGLKWDLSADGWATPLSFTAFSVPDPWTAGNPEIRGLSVNAPLVQINNPPLDGVTSGALIYYNSDDAALGCGFSFIDAKVPASPVYAAAMALLQGVGETNLVLQNSVGQVGFIDTENPSPIFIKTIMDLIAALDVRVSALE